MLDRVERAVQRRVASDHITDEIAALLPIHGNVSFFAAPTMVSRLINHSGFAAADHEGLRTIIYGGAPMHFETLLRGLDLLGPKFAQIYGQGEVPMTITALSKEMHADRARPRWREIMGSVGLLKGATRAYQARR